MTPDTLLRDLLQAGIEPGLTPDGENITVPAGRLTDSQRAAIRQFKAELIERLGESARLTSELLAAASRACDRYNDGPEARQAMREQILETPPQLRADLLAHFNTHYPRSVP